jgi:diguanylate cyclase (GGDEF)-like protein
MTIKHVLPYAAAVLAAHALTLILFPGNGLISNILMGICSLAAAILAYWRSYASIGPARTKWNLIAIGVGLWFVGQCLYIYYDSILKTRASHALGSDFYYFLYGIPILLAIASSNEDEGSTALLVIDSVQAVFAVCLAYLELFSFAFGHTDGSAASQVRLMYIYDAENVLLAVAATLRLLGNPQGEERRLYRILCCFLWTYAAIAAPLNYLDAVDQLPSGTWPDLAWDIPFLLLAVLALGTRIERKRPPALVETNPFALVINNGSPIIFTFAVLAMGAVLARRRFVLGIGAIAIALVLYSLRASLLQARYMRTQHKLLQSEAALLLANERLHELSFKDGLTGIYNRRKFDQSLELEWNRAQRTGNPLTLLMIDIDHFKNLNDRYGHVTGDSCLVSVAETLKNKLRRAGDLLARYGGEEFAAILPNMTTESAVGMAESLRRAVADLCIVNEGAPTGSTLTASVGVVTHLDFPNLPIESFLEVADRALYRAKCNGRNRVEVANSADVETLSEVH